MTAMTSAAGASTTIDWVDWSAMEQQASRLRRPERAGTRSATHG